MENEAEKRSEVSRILSQGGSGVPEELLAHVYRELQQLARAQMAREKAGHTLQPTALVHEAYLRLFGREPVAWKSRAHFYSAAAEAMRRILIDHARKKARLRRGGGRRRLPGSLLDLVQAENPEETLAVDEALRRLEDEDPEAARVVRLRFFAGLSVEETADVLGLSPRTVYREWSYAKAWLYDVLREDGGEESGPGGG
jgi:RNA polymerase sigma factor (TIGR02999 family)